MGARLLKLFLAEAGGVILVARLQTSVRVTAVLKLQALMGARSSVGHGGAETSGASGVLLMQVRDMATPTLRALWYMVGSSGVTV